MVFHVEIDVSKIICTFSFWLAGNLAARQSEAMLIEAIFITNMESDMDLNFTCPGLAIKCIAE